MHIYTGIVWLIGWEYGRPLYPPDTTRKYPDPYTNIADSNADIVTPAYAIETATWVLAPFQTVSVAGQKKNTPAHLYKEGTTPAPCGFSRIIKPDGSRAVPDVDRSFEGLIIVDVDLDECILSKTLLDMVSTSLFCIERERERERGGAD